MNRRQCLTALTGTAALAPVPALAGPSLDPDELWVRQQRRVLRRLRTGRGDPDLRRALVREGLPGNLAGEALAAMVLAQGFQELPRERRRSEAVQDLLWDEGPRIGTAMATWVSWLDGLGPERRQALDDHMTESPETLDLAEGLVAEKVMLTDLGPDLDRQLKRARKALRRRSIRWGLETILRRATDHARTEGLGDDQWRGGRYRQDPARAAPGRKGPVGLRFRGKPLPPVIAWGLRMLGVGLVFVTAAWLLGAVGTPVVGVLFLYVGLVCLLVGLFVLFWGAIVVGFGFHLPPPQRRRRGKPPPRKPTPR